MSSILWEPLGKSNETAVKKLQLYSVISKSMKLRWLSGPWLLTTIISDGSRTMHSHPRRKLPADLFPKLEEKNRIERLYTAQPIMESWDSVGMKACLESEPEEHIHTLVAVFLA